MHPLIAALGGLLQATNGTGIFNCPEGWLLSQTRDFYKVKRVSASGVVKGCMDRRDTDHYNPDGSHVGAPTLE